MLTYRRGDFSLCLPISPHDTPYLFIHHTSSWKPHQPTTYDAEPIRTIGLAIRIPYFNSFCMLRLCRNHSAFNSHNFPRTYTTTYPYVAAPPQPNALTRKAQGFGNYRSRLLSFLWPYFTALFHAVFFLATRDWSLSMPFQLRALHDPLRDYSPPILPLCFSTFSLLTGIARCTSLGVCGR